MAPACCRPMRRRRCSAAARGGFSAPLRRRAGSRERRSLPPAKAGGRPCRPPGAQERARDDRTRRRLERAAGDGGGLAAAPDLASRRRHPARLRDDAGRAQPPRFPGLHGDPGRHQGAQDRRQGLGRHQGRGAIHLQRLADHRALPGTGELRPLLVGKEPQPALGAARDLLHRPRRRQRRARPLLGREPPGERDRLFGHRIFHRRQLPARLFGGDPGLHGRMPGPEQFGQHVRRQPELCRGRLPDERPLRRRLSVGQCRSRRHLDRLGRLLRCGGDLALAAARPAGRGAAGAAEPRTAFGFGDRLVGRPPEGHPLRRLAALGDLLDRGARRGDRRRRYSVADLYVARARHRDRQLSGAAFECQHRHDRPVGADGKAGAAGQRHGGAHAIRHHRRRRRRGDGHPPRRRRPECGDQRVRDPDTGVARSRNLHDLRPLRAQLDPVTTVQYSLDQDDFIVEESTAGIHLGVTPARRRCARGRGRSPAALSTIRSRYRGRARPMR